MKINSSRAHLAICGAQRNRLRHVAAHPRVALARDERDEERLELRVGARDVVDALEAEGVEACGARRNNGGDGCFRYKCPPRGVGAPRAPGEHACAAIDIVVVVEELCASVAPFVSLLLLLLLFLPSSSTALHKIIIN